MEPVGTTESTPVISAPNLEPSGPPLPPPWQQRTRAWLEQQWRKREVRIAAAVCGTIVIFFAVVYLRLARMADRRLADGPFSLSTEILAAPETVAVGDSLTVAELAARLEQSGYSRSVSSPRGWFTVQPESIQIAAGPTSRTQTIRVEFAQGKVSNIVGLVDHAARREYELPERVLTNLSENREKRRLVRFAEIPHSLVDAVTSAEDKHFFEHGGFDYRRAVKAAYVDFRDGHKQQGASTLTMQLSRALWLDPAKSWRRKIEEILITFHLEHVLTKRQIFEDYANQIYLGRRGPYSINGFGEAARVFFGKELWQVDTAQAALLAGMVQRPSYYNPYRYPERAVSRRNLVLTLMRRNGKLSDPDFRAAAAEPLQLAPPATDESENSYFLSMLSDELQTTFGENGGQPRTVVSTLDPELQRDAEAAVRSGMEGVDRQLRGRIQGSARPQAALIALDPQTGEIRALVGGRDYTNSQLNHALAMRQPGSAFKPFVYAAAIETAINGSPHVFTPASNVNDQASTFAFEGQSYQPHDYHDDYQGTVSLRTALALSLNVAAVNLAQQVGYARVAEMAHRSGLNSAVGATPAVALGAYETTPLEIAGAYTVFADQGVWVKPTTIHEVRGEGGILLNRSGSERRNALDPRVAYIVTNMMQEVLRSGTGAAARAQGFLLPAAGKTGTSHDGWFAGFTSQLLCVVWVGFDDNRELNLEGARSALPIWADFMKHAAQIVPYRTAQDFRVPPGVVSAQICSETGQLAGPYCPRVRSEVFIAGTEPSTVCDSHHDTGTGDGQVP